MAIEAIRPVFTSVATSVDQQQSATTELARTATETSQFIANVADGAQATSPRPRSRRPGISESVDRSGKEAASTAEKLRTRFVMLLRQTEFGDRRRHDRLPCDLKVRLRSRHDRDYGAYGRPLRRRPAGARIRRGESADRRQARLRISTPSATIRSRLVNRSHLGLHLQGVTLSEKQQSLLKAKLDAIREENKEFIDRALEATARVVAALRESGRPTDC